MAGIVIDAPVEARPGRSRRVLPRMAGLDGFALVAVVVVTAGALLAPILAPHEPTARVGASFLAPGSDGFLLGTDDSGRDMLSRLLVAGRSTWLAVLVVLALSMLVGAAIGTVAGASGRWVDAVLMRITDIFLALPGPLLAIAVAAALGRSLTNTLLAITVVWWPWYARIVRNEVRALKARPHLFPGTVPPLLVTSSLDAGALIVTLATLSFFGLGAQPPAPELGSMTFTGANYLVDHWWIPVLPAAGVMVLSLVATLAGDAVRARFDDR